MSTPEHDSGALLLLTTIADDDAARRLAHALVEERLAACVTRHAVKSVYRWESKVCDEDEVLLVIKTSRARRRDLEARILALHSYDCPEIVAVVPDHVEAKYLAWLLAACA